MIGTTFSTPSRLARWFTSRLVSSPIAPMTVRNDPRDRCGWQPIRTISSVTRSMLACAALGLITMITTRLLVTLGGQETNDNNWRPGSGESCVVYGKGRRQTSGGGLDAHELRQMIEVDVTGVEVKTMLQG